MQLVTEPTAEEIEVVAILRGMLPSPHFFFPITVEDIRLEGGHPTTRLVVMLRMTERPERLYGLFTVLSDWDFERAGLGATTPSGWAGWLHDAVMEAVDAAPGLPLGPVGDDGVVWVDLDA